MNLENIDQYYSIKVLSSLSILILALVLVASLGLISADQNDNSENNNVDLDEEDLIDNDEFIPSNSSESNVTEYKYESKAVHYFEEVSEDWISYNNPRDQNHPDYVLDGGEYTVAERNSKIHEWKRERPGSGKVCISVMNENNEPISGATLNETSIKFRGLENLSWHDEVPFKVELPMHRNYEQPLDGDQFGITPLLPQGDGYLDSHCIEFHFVESDFSINHEGVQIDGAQSEDLEVVGYREKLGSWDSDINLSQDFYDLGKNENASGEVSMNKDQSHFQIVAALRLDR